LEAKFEDILLKILAGCSSMNFDVGKMTSAAALSVLCQKYRQQREKNGA